MLMEGSTPQEPKDQSLPVHLADRERGGFLPLFLGGHSASTQENG